MEINMQYWLSKKISRMERLEDSVLEKHPEKLQELESQGYVRVMSEYDLEPYKKPSKKQSIKKVVKKVAKKVTKKKK
tara:strand:+ start:473 stop:703 length:231 start_codon:yes stop_codon:yes gene_type:complete